MIWHQTIVRVRAGERTDRGGNTVPDWSETVVSRLTITDVSVQPGGMPDSQGESVTPERNAVATGWRVLSAPGTNPDVTAVDRIEYDGMTLEVNGEVARWPDPLDGGVHHVEFAMKRATG